MFKVYGSYPDFADASRSVDILLNMGYNRNQIRVVSKNNLDKNYDLRIGEPRKEDESVWERIKDAFTFEKYEDDFLEKDLDEDRIEFDRAKLNDYKATLEAGGALILIEESELADKGYDAVGRKDRGLEQIIEPHTQDIYVNEPNRVPFKDQDLPDTDKFKDNPKYKDDFKKK